jgi:peptidoglycan endopeptidase LytE
MLFAQERPRIVQNTEVTENQTVENSNKSYPPSPQTSSRPNLNSGIIIVNKSKNESSNDANTSIFNTPNISGNFYSDSINQRLNQAIKAKIGRPYVWGAEGPYSYDCSGLIWSVFRDAGINFERSNVHTYWREFQPVSENEKYKFGTLVFLNNLGHIGIVADEKGFYHASSSKGVTYSPFAGYWSKRVVGFRRIPMDTN